MRETIPLIFSGSSHPQLGRAIAASLQTEPGALALSCFPDGETSVELLEDVYRRDVFVLQSVALDPNVYLMELLLIVDALKRASARSVTAIIPYFGYCRQDRRERGGESISAKLVANLLTVAGVERLITCDLHTGQIEGFFEIPVDHLHCQQLLMKAALSHLGEIPLIVAPDVGSLKRAQRAVCGLGSDLVVIEKRRLEGDKTEMRLIGNVKGRKLLVIDDICSTGSTLLAAIDLCLEQGAESISAAITHTLCTRERALVIAASPLATLLTTDTVAAGARLRSIDSIVQLSVAPLIAAKITQLLRTYL